MTKKECSILRGVAILCIILHNFCKRIPFAVPENEYSFNLDNILLFWNTLQWDTVFIQFFSFWGHLGVPVFVLLSGYGLALKYDRIENLDWKDFLWRHYKKLCYPMVGGLLAYYIIRYLMSPYDYNGIQEIFPIKQFVAQLTMLINLLPEPHKLILPGPYWYFGMTMQLYVIYLIFVHKRPTAFIIIIAVATLFVCLFLQQYTSLLIRIKVNAAGWLLPFALGIIIGRSYKCCPPKYTKFVTLCAMGTIPLFSLTYYTWLIIPFAITILAIGIVPTIPGQLSSIFNFVGKISMYVFVIHPIVREMNFLYDLNPYMGILLYVTITLTLSYLINRILTKPINNK